MTMLDVQNLSVVFDGKVKAVDGISFSIGSNEVVGLVGESGSGKSVASLSLFNLLPSNGVINGSIMWKGQNVLTMSPREIRALRGREIGMIFQNPLASLNPVFTIGSQFIETVCLHRNVTKNEARDIAISLLTEVNIPDAASRLNDYPHQFSLGMCQRIMIALTLAMQPALLIADEPTASLDVTIQAQILALLRRIRSHYEMSVLLISHDLGVIAQQCDRILVMYLGTVVEEGTPEAIFCDPKHPYTQALIQAIPSPDPRIKREPVLLTGDVPSPVNLPSGCRFHTRCPKAVTQCRHDNPELKSRAGRRVACHFVS